jgi:hypothetical protein
MSDFAVKDLMVTVLPGVQTQEYVGGIEQCEGSYCPDDTEEREEPPCESGTACPEGTEPPCESGTACPEGSEEAECEGGTGCVDNSERAKNYGANSNEFWALSRELDRVLLTS